MADCKTCEHKGTNTHYCDECSSDYDMYERKIVTNADRIRAMSDEELAKERIDRIDIYTNSDLKEFIGDFAGIVNSDEEAIQKELEWLQSEAE